MTLKDLLILINAADIDKCKTVLETHCLVKSIKDAVKQYDPAQHKVMDTTLRTDKPIYDDSEDEEKQAQIVDYVKVARIPLALQKKIVRTAAAFIGTPQIDATPNTDPEKNLISAMKKTWDDNKLNYKFTNIKKTTMAFLQCAELWFVKDVDNTYWAGTNVTGKFKLSMLVLSSRKGDDLYPVFDDFGDMIAFGRGYKSINAEGKEDGHLDIYTAKEIYYLKKDGNSDATLFIDEAGNYSAGAKKIDNVIGKIPVSYYYQPSTEWSDVQWLIDRLEEILSNHADTNDYVGSPIVFAEDADNITFPKKGETGKLIQGTNGAKMSYLTYDAQPKSVQMEIDNLTKYIFSLTHTPDIAFENIKSLGYFSNIALQTLFLDARIKATDKEEIFGEGVQRRINFLKSALATIDVKLKPALTMNIAPKFNVLLPQDTKEIIETITAAIDGGILSTDSGVKQNPLVTDADSELEALSDESQQNPAPAQTIQLPIAK
jgi:SPP1 family phage portal protein